MVSKDEVYCFMCCEFKVYELYRWAKKNLKIASVNLENLSKNYGFIGNEDSNTESMFRLDKEHAKKLSKEDVAQPLLFVNLGVDCGCLMIDGTHRAFYQWHNGAKKADAYLIDDDAIIIKHSSLTKKFLKAMRNG